MATSDQFSVSEKLLLAALALEEAGHRPFSAEDLVVAAWRHYPDVFGLAGYSDEHGRLMYPNSNRVFAEIMGSKPIRKRGLLVKVGDKMYELTESGKEYAQLLINRRQGKHVEKAGLGRGIQHELERLLTCKANEKYRNGRLADLTFHDACGFWGISPRSSAIEFEGRTSNVIRIIEEVRKGIQERTVAFEHGGKVFSLQDLEALLELHHESCSTTPFMIAVSFGSARCATAIISSTFAGCSESG